MTHALAFRPGREHPALALVRKAAEVGATAGYVLTAAGAVRFMARGPLDAPPLLVLHGMGDSIPGWLTALAPLTRRFRVHAIDLPGHGVSADPPDWRLHTLLAAVREVARTLDRPLLVGHSLGGWLGAHLAAEGEVPLAGLVLVNPAGALLPRSAWEEFRSLVSAADREGARAYLRKAFHKPPLALRLFPGEIVKAMAAPAARGLLAALREEDFLTPAQLGRIRAPVRLVWGEEDHLLPFATLGYFREHLPDAEVVLLPKAAHCPHLEAPLRLARAIARPLAPAPARAAAGQALQP